MNDPARTPPERSAPAFPAGEAAISPAAALAARIEASWTSQAPADPPLPRRSFAEAACAVAEQLAQISRRLDLEPSDPTPEPAPRFLPAAPSPAPDAALQQRVAALEAQVSELAALLSLHPQTATVWSLPPQAEPPVEPAAGPAPPRPAPDPELDAALEAFLDSLD